MNEQKIEKIKSLLCKSDQIGTVKDRFFSTSQEDMKVGGVSIYLPQFLDKLYTQRKIITLLHDTCQSYVDFKVVVTY